MFSDTAEVLLAFVAFFQFGHWLILLVSRYVFGILAIILYCEVMGINDD